MLIYNGQIIAGGGTIVLPMTRAEYEANKAILDSADVWVDLTDEPDQVATAEQIAYSVDGVQKGMNYIGDIATKAVAKVEPTDTALYLHEVGEYFINKDGNACKVDIQIPVNGAITLGTNCHVLPKGVANDINSNLSEKFATQDFPSPSGFADLQLGAYSGYFDIDITKTGYTPIGVCMAGMGHPASYHILPVIESSTTCKCIIYGAVTSAHNTMPAGDFYIRVLYKKA